MIIDKAIEIAVIAHSGQTRKYSGLPYIVHPIEVMTIVHEIGGTPEMCAAAILHDVLEDTDISATYLLTKFGGEVYAMILGMTKESWDGNRAARKEKERARLARETADVQTIKLADIISNSKTIAADDPGFAAVYLPEQELLINVLDKGNQTLAFRARDVVQRQSDYLKGNVCHI